MHCMIRFAYCAFSLLLLSTSVTWAVPPVLNYAGQVAVNGQAFNGEGRLKFALVNPDGNFTHWSHDGTSVGGSEPDGHVTVPVRGGLYSILLGNTSIPGMGAMDPSLFQQISNLHLRVWFSDGVNGFERISPDRSFASVPYAMSADIGPGTITKDTLSSALRSELFPPATNEPQINGTLENPYGWDGEVVIGNLDANYTVPVGKVLVVTSTVSDIYSDEIVFKNQSGNAFVPAGKEVGGRFTGLLFNENAALTPVVATSVSNGEVVYNVPSDKLFVITGGAFTAYFSEPRAPKFYVDGKAVLAGIGGNVIVSSSSEIRSNAESSMFLVLGQNTIQQNKFLYYCGGFTGYLISPENLKKLD
jgi:hypothetical protein